MFPVGKLRRLPRAILVWGLLVAGVRAPRPLTAQNLRGVPSVEGRFLPEALAILADSGFVNVRVVRTTMDDMPGELVLRQSPDRTPVAGFPSVGPRLLPASTVVWLEVVDPLPVLPDLTGWRADRALTYVRALHRDLSADLADPNVDPGGSVVVAQSVPPGPVLPPASVLLRTGPLAQDTVIQEVEVPVPVIDTVIDTVVASAPVGATDPLSGPGAALLVFVSAIAGIGGAGLGLIGCRLAGPKLPKPRTPAAPPPSARAAEPDDRAGRRRGLDLPDMLPVIADEAVWISGGAVRPTTDPPASRRTDP